jgi:hypothetical protein
VPGMASRWRGWPHRTDGDWGDAPHWSDVTTLSWASVEQASVPFSRAPPSSVKGAALDPYEWVAQCHGADTGLTAQCRVVAGMASPGGVGGVASGYDS